MGLLMGDGKAMVDAKDLQKPSEHLLSPPAVFAIVCENIYRAGAIHPHNLGFLELLKLKTVVNLSSDIPIRDVQAFYRATSVNFIHLGKSYPDPDELSMLITRALEILLDQSYHPVLFHCSTGSNETGVVIGCLRRLQYWNLTSILYEYRTYTENPTTTNEHFIEFFDPSSFKLPANLPDWFEEELKLMEEEECDRVDTNSNSSE